MADQGGLSDVPAALRDRGETLALQDGRSIFIGRWTAQKSIQVAKFLSALVASVDLAQLNELRTPAAIAQLLLEVAEEKAFAFAHMCLTAEDRASVDVRNVDWIDFVSILEAIFRINMKEDDRKKLAGLVRSLPASAAGPLSTRSSQPSAV